MVDTNDWEWLQEYAGSGSQEAFGRLVARHLEMVYSACRRQFRDEHLAEDATQAVFLILSRKARSIRRGAVLQGWLYNTARYVAANLSRTESLRRRHEREAARVARAAASADPEGPDLDAALARLRRRDRDAILLRFFEGRSLREVGEALAISEDAAKKRVTRGLDRLRRLLTAPGGAALSAAGVLSLVETGKCATPPGLASSVMSAACGRAPARPAALAREVIRMFTYKKIATTLAALVLIVGAAGGGVAAVRALAAPPPAQANADNKLARQLGRTIPDLDIQGVGLADTIGFLHDVTGVNFTVDYAALKDAGVDKDAAVTCQSHGDTAIQAVQVVLWSAAKPGTLQYAITPDGITISSAKALRLPEGKPEAERDARVRSSLEEKLPAGKLDDLGLYDAVKRLSDAARVPTWLDAAALKEAKVSSSQKVTLGDYAGTPGAAEIKALLSALKPSKPLDHQVIDGMVVVSTPERMKELVHSVHVSHRRDLAK